MKTGFSQGMGKYREIVIAVAFFLVFDLVVLVLNFYISFQLSADAVSINLSGRQRMLSQRMTKVLYGLNKAHLDGQPTAELVAELQLSSELFGETLTGLTEGATVTGGADKPQALARARTAKERAILAEAHALWNPLHALIAPLISGGIDDAKLDAAVDYARGNNLKLLNLMNNLTTELEEEAQNRTDRLRMIQAAGIILAFLNFLFILFKFVRRLKERDEEVDAAHQETLEILATVREGLFLLDRNFCVGRQFSASLRRLLDCPIAPGDSFLDYLRRHLIGSDFEAARDFMGLLFSERGVEKLMGDLNPLIRVEIRSEKAGKRYLRFRFNPVRSEGITRHLLVTAQDITEQTRLAKDLENARQEAKGELSVLLDLLNTNPTLLGAFLKNARQTLESMDQQFKNLGKSEPRALVDMLFRHTHTLKGEAATLGLELFEQAFQLFEASLRELRGRTALSSEALLILIPHLKTCFARVEQAEKLIERLHRFQGQDELAGRMHPCLRPETGEADPETEAFIAQTRRLAERIATTYGKRVRIEADLGAFSRLNEQQRHYLRDIITQCVRNAIVHGIELPEVRQLAGKPGQGLLTLRLFDVDTGEMVLECRDDGSGLDHGRIRETLVQSGRYSAETVKSYTPQQIVSAIFESGVSTAAEGGRDAGQGVGLAVVKERAEELGGRLRLTSRPGTFTAFGVRFPFDPAHS